MNAINDDPLTAILALTQHEGVKSIKDLQGAWICEIDKTWTVAANGHPEPVKVEPDGMMGIDIPFAHFAVWYNGWLAGLFSPAGGEFVAGGEANQETFCAAIERRIKGGTE